MASPTGGIPGDKLLLRLVELLALTCQRDWGKALHELERVRESLEFELEMQRCKRPSR